jgi:hypothetical protein
MSLFQRRHFDKIAEIAVWMDLSDWQLNVLTMSLVGTNPNFNAIKFKKNVMKEMEKNE